VVNTAGGTTTTVTGSVESGIASGFIKDGLGTLVLQSANPGLLGSTLVTGGTLRIKDEQGLGPNPTAQQTFTIAPQAPSTTGNFSEVQRLTFSGLTATTAGFFVLKYGGGTERIVVWDPNNITSTTALNQFINSQLLPALQAMFGANVSVTVNSTTPAVAPFTDVSFDIKFTQALGGANMDQILVDGGTTTGGDFGPGSGQISTVANGAGTERFTVTMPTAADATTTGAFLLSYGDPAVTSQTVPVLYSANADSMRQGIETA